MLQAMTTALQLWELYHFVYVGYDLVFGLGSIGDVVSVCVKYIVFMREGGKRLVKDGHSTDS